MSTGDRARPRSILPILRCAAARWRWTLRTWRGLALLRALWWRHVRRYEYEVCHMCGRPVGRCTGSWWRADDELWIDGGGPLWGVLCPPCFTRCCDAAGQPVHYVAVRGV